ncbi:MAG TPA: hypothetical protein VI588_02770 [Candidatus Gracilibacteria bacterium]|nr:hypothetical protein [Candidatus Gracilibacteria bacterium]
MSDGIEVNGGKVMGSVFFPDFCRGESVDGKRVAVDSRSFAALLPEFFPELRHDVRSKITIDDVRVGKILMEEIFHGDVHFCSAQPFSHVGPDIGDGGVFEPAGCHFRILLGFDQETSVTTPEIIHFFPFFQFCQLCYVPDNPFACRNEGDFRENVDQDREQH